MIHILTMWKLHSNTLQKIMIYRMYKSILYSLETINVNWDYIVRYHMEPATNKLSHCAVQCLGWWFTPPMLHQMMQGQIEHKTFSGPDWFKPVQNGANRSKTVHRKGHADDNGPDRGLSIIFAAVFSTLWKTWVAWPWANFWNCHYEGCGPDRGLSIICEAVFSTW